MGTFFFCRLLTLIVFLHFSCRTSIDAQKQVDEYMRPQFLGHMYYLSEEQRPRAFNSFTCVNSYFKGRAGGAGSSFKSCRFYTDQAREQRNELMEEIEAENK
jgi:hypothetical protein